MDCLTKVPEINRIQSKDAIHSTTATVWRIHMRVLMALDLPQRRATQFWAMLGGMPWDQTALQELVCTHHHHLIFQPHLHLHPHLRMYRLALRIAMIQTALAASCRPFMTQANQHARAGLESILHHAVAATGRVVAAMSSMNLGRLWLVAVALAEKLRIPSQLRPHRSALTASIRLREGWV